MSDYTPVYVPGKVITLTASGAVSGGDLLTVSGNNQVQKLTFGAATQQIVGVAAEDTPANGRVTVYARGIVHESVPVGTISAGALLTTPITGDTAGAQVKAIAAVTTPTPADVTDSRDIIGICISGAANPNKVRWMEF